MRSDPKSAATLETEIAHLRGLDLDGLRARWHSNTGRRAPAHIPKHLLLRIMAYRLQAACFGDLDKATRRVLQEVADRATQGIASPVRPLSRSKPEARPGTILMREWNGIDHRVMALDDAYAWNGKTFRSLSKVAHAITGTRWSGPRFFGLQQNGPSSGGGP